METQGEFKIILVGCTEVGKTSLIDRYIQNQFNLNITNSRFASDLRIKIVEYEGAKYSLKIFDTSGQERYDCLTRSFYNDAHGAFLIYDITDSGSFARLKKWHARLEENCPQAPIMLIGNKKDLEDQRQVSEELASSYAREHNINCMETSALNGEGVEICFEKMIEKAVYGLKMKMAIFQKSFQDGCSMIQGKSIIKISESPVKPSKSKRGKKSSNCC